MAEAGKPADRTRLMVLGGLLAAVSVAAVAIGLRQAGQERGPRGRDTISYTPHRLPPLEVGEVEQASGRGVATSRNPFAFGAPPTPTPRPVTPLPTQPPPTPPPTPTPRMAIDEHGQLKPPPPPFNREYLGHFGPLRLQVAAFRTRGADPETREVEVAVAGEVLDGIYIVREIGLESVVIGFAGYDSSEDTRVPLADR